METFTFIPDQKTKGFSIEVPDGTLNSPEMQNSISKHYNEFLSSDIEKAKNAGDNFAKVIIALGTIAASYFLGKKMMKEEKEITLDDLKKMPFKEAADWAHEASLTDLENICKSDEDIANLFEVIEVVVTKATEKTLDWEKWRETSNGFQEFLHKYGAKFMKKD